MILLQDKRLRSQLTYLINDLLPYPSPAISGNLIVWEDYRSGFTDIFLCTYDPATGNCPEQLLTPDDGSDKLNPDISGELMVYQGINYLDFPNHNYDIYLYDLTTGQETQITTDLSNQRSPAISGNLIVWEDFRNDNRDIYLYDLEAEQEQRITNLEGVQPVFSLSPDISGNLITWTDTRNGNNDIYLYNMVNGIEERITINNQHQIFPSISGNLLTWSDLRNFNSDIYLYELPKIAPCNNYGDINLDGFVTEEDSELAGNIAVGLITPANEQFLRADVDFDGDVDVLDASSISQYANGVQDTFPVCFMPPCGNYGDVDDDGLVLENDAQLALEISVGNIDPSEEQFTRTDVNVDGVINVFDSLSILKYSEGLKDTFPVCS